MRLTLENCWWGFYEVDLEKVLQGLKAVEVQQMHGIYLEHNNRFVLFFMLQNAVAIALFVMNPESQKSLDFRSSERPENAHSSTFRSPKLSLESWILHCLRENLSEYPCLTTPINGGTLQKAVFLNLDCKENNLTGISYHTWAPRWSNVGLCLVLNPTFKWSFPWKKIQQFRKGPAKVELTCRTFLMVLAPHKNGHCALSACDQDRSNQYNIPCALVLTINKILILAGSNIWKGTVVWRFCK